MSARKKKGTPAAALRASLRGLPHTNAVDPATAVPALLERIDALQDELAGKPIRHTPDVAAEIDEIRRQLLREARKMIPEAVRKARAGKPALLRLIHRIAR